MSAAIEPEAADPSSDNTPQEAKKPEHPVDPRRAKPVLDALAYAAKRDPAHDVLKPVGRGAFLILAVILVGLIATTSVVPWSTEVQVAKEVWSDSAKTYSGLAGSQHERAQALKRLDRNPEMVARVTIVTFVAGIGVLAAYYALIYLFGKTMLRAAVATGRGLNRAVVQPAARAAGRAVRRSRERRLVNARETPAGTQPKLQ